MIEVNKIYNEPCDVTLSRIPDNSINCCITSPPYYGLRDYGHKDQIGLEETPEEYVAKIASVFSEVKRVLKPEGTLWLNIGDSYAANRTYQVHSSKDAKNHTHSRGMQMPDFSYFVNRSFKDTLFFVGNANPIGFSAERVNVFIYDKSAPNLVFIPLLRVQSILIKEGKNYLGQIGNCFNSPINCYIGVSADLWLTLPTNTDFKSVVDVINNWGIVVSTGNLNTDTALSAAISDTKQSRKATFAIEVAGEPISESIRNIQPAWDAISFNLLPEGIINVNSINQSVSLSDAFNWGITNLGNFFVAKPSSKKVDFLHHFGRIDISVLCVSHLYSFSKVGIVPYSQIYEQSKQDANEFAPKNEIGIPDMVKRALKRDGWICRQTIIWSKPNPMPESVTDRCTKAHEYIFLLSKSREYYYDQEAIKQPVTDATIQRLAQQIENQKGSDRVPGKTNGNMKAVGPGRNPRTGIDRKGGNQGSEKGIPAMAINGRGVNGHSGYFDAEGNLIGDGKANKKSVWTVTTKPFKEAHFATFPEALIIDMIKAGCPENGIVYDPFMGAGTTGLVCRKLNRNFIGSEINHLYCEIANRRIQPFLQQKNIFDDLC